jgi:hypothetical protein
VNIIKRMLLLLFAVMFISLPACKSDTNNTPEKTTAAPVTALVLADNGVCDYTVVRSDFSKGAELEAAVLVCSRIEEITGARPNITTDWDKNPVSDHEIIVGQTLREETEGYSVDRAALGKNGYIIEAVGEKLFITGGSEEATLSAVEYFLDTFAKSSVVTVDANYKYAVYQEFDIRSLNICGKNYADFILVCDSKSVEESANTLADKLADKTGKRLEIITDENYISDYGPDDNVILITSKKPESSGIHLVKAENGWLTFASSSSETGIDGCVSRFIAQYIDGAKGDCSISDGFTYAVIGDYISIKDPRNS